uniref:Uncharacterized protein n=1 Tax=Anopheles farauti TaxID=69004 RepID=A0A182QPX6_9DIPT
MAVHELPPVDNHATLSPHAEGFSIQQGSSIILTERIWECGRARALRKEVATGNQIFVRCHIHHAVPYSFDFAEHSQQIFARQLTQFLARPRCERCAVGVRTVRQHIEQVGILGDIVQPNGSVRNSVKVSTKTDMIGAGDSFNVVEMV